MISPLSQVPRGQGAFRAAAARAHRVADFVQEIHRIGNVGVNDRACLVLIEKRPTEIAPGTGQQHIDGSAVCRTAQFIPAFDGCPVDTHEDTSP